MFLNRISRQNLNHLLLISTRLTRRLSNLHDRYIFKPPPSFSPTDPPNSNPSRPPPKLRYRPPSSLDGGDGPVHSDLPFDFRFSYTESSPAVRPIGLREPKYSPFGPGRLDRQWVGVCAPVVDPKVTSAEVEEVKLEEERRRRREAVQGEPLSEAERKILVQKNKRGRTKKQINLGRDGLTHNMLTDIHNHWKYEEAVRIKCQGVPTVDMKNVCSQLEDKTFGKIVYRHSSLIILYRGRNYNPKKRPVIPLMLWKPHEPKYPKLIKTTIDGLSVQETKEMRKRGLAVPVLIKLCRNGYYGNLVLMVRDAFLSSELVRIDCKGLQKSDYKKIGCKLRDLVPCILVTFDKEQIVVWRGNEYKHIENGYFLPEQELLDSPEGDFNSVAELCDSPDVNSSENELYSGDSDDHTSEKEFYSGDEDL